MRTLNLSEMETQIIGSGDFLDGVLCGIGIATAMTYFGAVVAVVGCSRALGII